MSRTVAAVVALTLGVPVLAFIAAVAAAGANPSLISNGTTFFVVLAAVVAMVIEIKSLADEPGTPDAHA
jgi:FtsH-binding integral membrane protein